MLPQLHIKVGTFENPIIPILTWLMQAGKLYLILRGRQNETVVKELCIGSATASETFQVKSTYRMADHGSSESGINWADGHIE